MNNNSLGKRILNNMDIMIAFGVIGIIAMIIIPMEPFMLDIFLTLNISLGIIILLLTLFSKDILEFSVFPTLLLVTTLFRLGLNVSSTRLILSQGNAGAVIQAFGGFVTGNNYIVGAIIFIIIVVIQFIVITSGAGRVAEVAARFTLDAMPGKQMSVDADLNAGLISETEAKERRQKLQQEADFYGAMDGASKFVKGDAIAGIVIVFINFIGGIIIFSIQGGISVGEAVRVFGILTIGDGLVSQIPALLISTASGILVTSSTSERNFGDELTSQLLSSYKVVGVTSVVLLAMGMIPALPNIPFLAIGAVCGVIAYLLREEEKQSEAQALMPAEEEVESQSGEPEDVTSYMQLETIELEIGYGLIPLIEKSEGGDLLNRIAAIRRQNAAELGVLIPPIRIRDNLSLGPNTYSINIRGTRMTMGEIQPNGILVMDPGNSEIDIAGTQTVEPAFGLPAIWADKSDKDKAEMRGYTIVEPTAVMITHLSEVIKTHSHELLGRQEVKQLIDHINEKYPAVVEELIPEKMTIGEVQKVLQNLLKEKVSIKDLLTILETLADYAGNIKDTEVLTEYVRYKIGRNIVGEYVDERNKMDIITIHPNLDQYIHEHIQKSIQGSMPIIEPDKNTKILESLDFILAENATRRPVVLASPRSRVAFKKLIEMTFPSVPVLSLNEIPNTVELEGIGMVRIDDD